MIQFADRILFNHQSQKDLIGRKALGSLLKLVDQLRDQFSDPFFRLKVFELHVVLHVRVINSPAPGEVTRGA